MKGLWKDEAGQPFRLEENSNLNGDQLSVIMT